MTLVMGSDADELPVVRQRYTSRRGLAATVSSANNQRWLVGSSVMR